MVIARDSKGRFPARSNEVILSDAHSCVSLTDFITRFGPSYQLARRRKLDISFLPRAKRVNGYWTKDKCTEAARRFSGMGRAAFERGEPVAYGVALAKGWLNDMPWIGVAKNPFNDGMYFVYAYVFEDSKTAYVGLTVDKTRRDRDHRGGERYSAVYNYSTENGVEIPEMTILSQGLVAESAQYYEAYWCNEMKKRGYKLLNKAAVGVGVGSLGSVILHKWNDERAIEESKKYKSRNQFSEHCHRGYDYVCKHKLWDKIPWLQNKGNITTFRSKYV